MAKLRDIGIKPHYKIWEIFLTRKINLVLLIAFINLSIFHFVFGIVIDFYFLSPYLAAGQILLIFTIIMSITRNYLWGVYCFFLIGISLVLIMSVKLGPDNNMQLYYFPIILNIIQLLGRKETRKHMYVILGYFVIALLLLVYLFSKNEYQVEDNPDFHQLIKGFNMIMSSVVTLVFITMITFQNQVQEERINSMLNEKDVLMAEIFHRVKNNMNIITSLLNLKKNSTNNEETIAVLEDCRNRVFSMALVHQKIFSQKNISGLNFGEYTQELIKEITNSLGKGKDDKIEVEIVPMPLDLDQAIPCGLILNELITNSFKHGRTPGQPLLINVLLKENGSKRQLFFKDNGPGIKETDFDKIDSLGIDLIQSLSDQIDGTCTFANNNGFTFTLSF